MVFSIFEYYLVILDDLLQREHNFVLPLLIVLRVFHWERSEIYVLNWSLGISSVSECLSNDYATSLYTLILMEFEINLLGTKAETTRVWIFISLPFQNGCRFCGFFHCYGQ